MHQIKSVLIITPYFAPQSHAAVFRAYKLAKQLPQWGWKPYILTVGTNYLYNEDPLLLEKLPAEVEIIKSKYIEPTLRGLRMAVGGQNRSFSALKSSGKITAKESQENNYLKRMTRGVYNYALENWSYNPDPYWTWFLTASRKGKETIKQHHIPLVFTTFVPYTCLNLGNYFKSLGCRWVSDFRDPGTFMPSTSSHVKRIFKIQKEIEQNTLKSADFLTGLSSSYDAIYRQMYPHWKGEIQFIPTGLDTDLLEKSMPDDSNIAEDPYVLFVGELLQGYDISFFESFHLALKNTEFKNKNFKIIIAGHLQINLNRSKLFIEKYNLQKYVIFKDHMPQENLYKLIHKASAVLLNPGRQSPFWWTNFAKMVDYIALKKMVFAIVPDASEARTQLTQCGLGIFLDGSVSENAKLITDSLLTQNSNYDPKEENCQKYLSENMTKAFVNIFEKALELQKS